MTFFVLLQAAFVQKNVITTHFVVQKNVIAACFIVQKNVINMEREVYNQLIIWKKSPSRRPLILNGARQVGKTWLLQEFARREYKKVAAFSLDRHVEARGVFERGGDIQQLLRGLSALAAVDITPGDTLLILDEIQDCPQALTSLKYFCEDAPDIHVAVAGSLLGISMHEQSSFPVGKVDIIRVYPMNFNEFLRALGRDQMADELAKGEWEILDVLHGSYVDLLRQYYYVGGMPGVVAAYSSRGLLQEVRELQKKILVDYEEDFSKHAPANEVPRIRMVWNSVPSQLAKENKKFIYSALRQGARASAFEVAIQWLVDAGLLYKVPKVNAVKMPLKFYEDFNAFKLFMLDVGLMGAMVDAPAAAMMVGNSVFTEYKGAFTELYVCMQMQGIKLPLFYYNADNSRIELDFVTQIGTSALPIEVKAELNVHAKSMSTLLAKNPDLSGICLSMKPHFIKGRMEYIPLFAFREEFTRRNS